VAKGSVETPPLAASSKSLLKPGLLCTYTPQIRDLGSGNFGVAKLMRDKQTNELVAVKFIERGPKVSSVSM
jgi:hypothetical protein